MTAAATAANAHETTVRLDDVASFMTQPFCRS